MNGTALRDAGIEQAGSGVSVVSDNLWTWKARRAIIHLSMADTSFTAEDVRKTAGEPPIPNMMGAAFRSAYKDGIIIPDGVVTAERPSRHASLLRSWRRA